MLPAIVVMGPSGSGKSTLAKALADVLESDFLEGDEYHPPQNIAKMSSGQALTDQDRAAFLDSIGRALASSRRGAVARCSALRRTYRDRLRSYVPDILFVWLDVDPRELTKRVQHRSGHFMPAALLPDQLATFEPPGPGEDFVRVDGGLPTSGQVRAVLRHLARNPD